MQHGGPNPTMATTLTANLTPLQQARKDLADPSTDPLEPGIDLLQRIRRQAIRQYARDLVFANELRKLADSVERHAYASTCEKCRHEALSRLRLAVYSTCTSA